jgi:hypothetical protein
MYSVIFAAVLGLAAATTDQSTSDIYKRPHRVTLGVDCAVQDKTDGVGIIGHFPRNSEGAGLKKTCLWPEHTDAEKNMHFCVLDGGIFRGFDSGYHANTAADGRCTLAGTKRSVADVEDKRADVELLIPYAWIRRDEKFNEAQVSCAPELRLLVDDEVVAHTDTTYDPAGHHYPRDGEAEFKVKISVTEAKIHKLAVQYRDGKGCDDFDDDDDAQKRTFIDIESLDLLTNDSPNNKQCRVRDNTPKSKKRDVESSSSSSSSSSDDDDDSSSGTDVDVTGIRESNRFNCVALDQAVLMRVADDDDDDDSSSSSSSSD